MNLSIPKTINPFTTRIGNAVIDEIANSTKIVNPPKPEKRKQHSTGEKEPDIYHLTCSSPSRIKFSSCGTNPKHKSSNN